MSDVTLQERLDAATVDLGECETADDIAEILRAEGITGHLGLCAACPLAMLLVKRLDGVYVEVDGDDYAAFGHWGEIARASIGDAAHEFIDAFDKHGYEELAVVGSPCPDEECKRCYPGNPPTAVTPNG